MTAERFDETTPPSTDGLLTVDDLAQVTGVPSRTIRFYRQTGLLPAPRKIGRRAFYDPGHAERLRIIGALRDRGLGLDSIAKLLDEPDGEHATALIGIADELRRPWTEDQAMVMSRAEILQHLGLEREHSIENLVRYGVITPITEPDDAPGPTDESLERYHVPSVNTLDLAGDLKVTGLTPEFMFEAWQAMQEHFGELARRLVALYTAEYEAGGVERHDGDDVIASMLLARPVAQRAANQLFATAMQQALAEYVESGRVLNLPAPGSHPPE